MKNPYDFNSLTCSDSTDPIGFWKKSQIQIELESKGFFLWSNYDKDEAKQALESRIKEYGKDNVKYANAFDYLAHPHEEMIAVYVKRSNQK